MGGLRYVTASFLVPVLYAVNSHVNLITFIVHPGLSSQLTCVLQLCSVLCRHNPLGNLSNLFALYYLLPNILVRCAISVISFFLIKYSHTSLAYQLLDYTYTHLIITLDEKLCVTT